MRLSYICADKGVPVFGRKGCSIHVQEVIRGMLKRGVHVDLFASRTGGDAPADFQSVNRRHLPAMESKHRVAHAIEQMNRGITKQLRMNGKCDVIYERYSLWSYAALEFAREQGIPRLLEVNAPLIEEAAQYRGLVDRELAEHAAKRAFKAASALIAVSQEVADHLSEWPENNGKVHVVPNGVDPDRFAYERNTQHGEKPFTVGFVGTLKPWHGVDDLLVAFDELSRQYPDVRLLIVGDGPERETLQNTASCLFASRQSDVEFTGAVEPEAVPALLASMDVAVAPYPRLPGFYFSPLKVMEYMAAGLPVIASRIGALARLIEDGATGILTEPGDPRAISDALFHLYRDGGECVRLGKTARRHVVAAHTWDHAVDRILRLVSSRPQVLGAEIS